MDSDTTDRDTTAGFSSTPATSTLQLFDHPYNTTILNERAVEIPVVMAWLYRGDPLGDVLEVGNVLQHYGDVLDVPTRRIVDRYETGPHVENLDVFDITGRYDTIVTISTVEHVGWDPPEPRTPGRSVEAIKHLASLLTPTGRMLVTVPTGWNQPLDDWLADRPAAAAVTFRRDGDGWVLTDDLTFLPYGATTRWAESVFIGEFRS